MGISTWSKKVARSSIMKHGNASDVSPVPESTRYNQPRLTRLPRHRPLADLRRTRRRVGAEGEPQGGRGRGRGRAVVVEQEPAPAGERLPIVILPAAARARGEEIEREVREDMAEGLRELREQRLTI
jgi:hypothetical protein